MLKQKRPLLRTTSIHVDPSERTIKSALSPKLIKLMIPPRANPRRLDRVRVPPSTPRQLEGTATASLSLYLYSIQPVASLSLPLAWLDVARKSREKKLHYLSHQYRRRQMLNATVRRLYQIIILKAIYNERINLMG